MYIIHIVVDNDKLANNGISPEQFWKTAKLNMEENEFMQLEGDEHWYINWEDTATLGHVWALQFAWEDDLPEYASAMTKYEVYETFEVVEPVVNDTDKKRFGFLKSLQSFQNDNIVFERAFNCLNLMMEDVLAAEKKAAKKKRRKKKD